MRAALLSAAVALWLCCWMSVAQAAAWPLDRAQVSEGRWGAAASTGEAPAWRNVALPDAWWVSGRSGAWTYRLMLNVCGADEGASCVPAHRLKALWIPKAGRELAVWVQGHQVLQLGGQGGQALGPDMAGRPVWVNVPGLLWQPGLNEVRLEVQAPAHDIAGLSRVWIGDESDLRWMHDTRDHLAIGMPASVATGAAILAALSVILAWRFGGGSLWLFAWISALWGVKELLPVLGTFWWPFDTVLGIAGWLQGVAVLLSCWLFLDMLAVRGRPWVCGVQCMLCVSPVALLGAGLGGDHAWAWRWGWHLSANAVGVLMTWVALHEVARRPSWPKATVLAGMVGAAALGFIDDWRFLLSGDHRGFE